MNKALNFLLVCTGVLVSVLSVAGAGTVEVDHHRVIREVDHGALLGSNLALWHDPGNFEQAAFKQLMRGWKPGIIRLPGGSWSNEYYWNGHGVRSGDKTFDHSKHTDGGWVIDYSDYAPGFRVHGSAQEISDYHGVLDVQKQHQIAESFGISQMVTVNVGTGTPQMAVEWLKWARLENGFNVPFWEIGNELNGEWENGHFLPDGSRMTGEIYAGRFLEYSRALKAVDSSIKVGGPACSDLELAFVEDLIRIAGAELDFVSIHAYPVGVQRVNAEDKFADIKQLEPAINKVKDWIEAYHPDRIGEIDIAVTEWNMKVNEDRDTADMISGLWTAAWIGEMFKTGVSFAAQWDMFTMTKAGGHSAFHIDDGRIIPKSHYWAHYLWSNFMGTTLVDHDVVESGGLSVFTTKSDTAVQVMLINRNPAQAESVSVSLACGSEMGGEGSVVTFSSREYLWDPHHHKPVYSNPPSVESMATGDVMELHVPAFSIQILEIPFAGETPVASPSMFDALAPRLILITPDESPADLPVELIVAAVNDAGKRAFRGDLGKVKLSVKGATISNTSIVLDQSVGRVFLTPTGPGIMEIEVAAGPLKASQSIQLVAVQSRPLVVWTFDNPISEWGIESTFKAGMEPSIKPNEYVASVTLDAALPGENKDVLLNFTVIPGNMEKTNIGGFFGELRASRDFACADPDALVNIVLQSEADHWIVLGSVPLVDLRGHWNTFSLEIEDQRILKAMARLYAVRFVIQSTQPFTGHVYFDNLGFHIRSHTPD